MTTGSATAAGGGSSPPLRPQPARPSAATSAPMAAIRTSRRSDQELKSGLLNGPHHSRPEVSGDTMTDQPAPRRNTDSFGLPRLFLSDFAGFALPAPFSQ